jgi:hypothetical protein
MMIGKMDIYNYFKKYPNMEFSKEEIINIFSKSTEDEVEIEHFLSEMEVESTYSDSSLFVTCKGGTVYYKWNESA